MSADEIHDENDPFVAHFHREPLPEAGVRVIQITELTEDAAQTVVAPLDLWFRSSGRAIEIRVIRVDRTTVRLGEALETALDRTSLPLVLITTAVEPWTPAHLEPLLQSINLCDHVLGRRTVGSWAKVMRWVGGLPRRLVFAVPLVDVHSPCQLHRTEKLAAIPLESRSSLVDTEILAKATFLGHLLGEVDVPALGSQTFRTGWWADLARLLKRPRFRHRETSQEQGSGPLEDAQGQVERADGPGRQDGDGLEDVVLEEVCTVEDDQSKRADQLSEREGLDQGLNAGGEPLGGKEDAREKVHRQHDQVHEPADRLGRAGPAGDQQADSREGQRAQNIDQQDQEQVAADRHAEGQNSQEQEDRHIRDQKCEAGSQDRAQEIAPGHRSGDVTLQQLANPHVDEKEANAPEAPAHGVDADQARDQKVDIA
jgi:hypothetical protein